MKHRFLGFYIEPRINGRNISPKFTSQCISNSQRLCGFQSATGDKRVWVKHLLRVPSNVESREVELVRDWDVCPMPW